VGRSRILGVVVGGAALLTIGAGAGGARSIPAATKKPKTVVVAVKDDVYAPMKLKVKKDTPIKWSWVSTNYDSHNVKLTKGPKGVKLSKFVSPTGTIELTWKRTLTVPGTYSFLCTLHPDSMYMTVVVSKH
jgi:plastocyanin